MSSSIRVAYILQIHKNPSQVNKFILQLLSDEHSRIFVHIDKRSNTSLREKIITHPQVNILEKSVTCEWGDISQVDTTLLLLKEVMNSGEEYDFVCLRSGQDMVIKNGFNQFLADNREKIFIKLKDVSKSNLGLMEINWPKRTRKRYKNVHPLRMYRRVIQSLYRQGMNLYPNRNYFPKEYSFSVGSQWFTIPFNVAAFIMTFLEENPWYHEYFQHTMCPDEWYFQTLIMNSPHKSHVVNNNLLFLKWGETFSERNSPQDLKWEDITAIEQSDYFFARKFDENVDDEIIDYFAANCQIGNIEMKQRSNMVN